MDPEISKILNPKRTKITVSGRISVRPKTICTTSEDDVPSAKKSKTYKPIQEEKEFLRCQLKLLEQPRDLIEKTDTDHTKINPEKKQCSSSYTSSKSSRPNSDDSIADVSANLNICGASALSKINAESDGVLTDPNVIHLLKEVKKQGEDIIWQYSDLKKEIVVMKKEIVYIKRSFQEQSQTSSGDLSFSEKLLAPLEGFPLQTLEQFQNLGEKENLKLRRTVYRHLINRGGAKQTN
ncbi:uncharacterized protein LOC117173070 [Belonocnema kinseyi]|uniref:uncharacterized protein LOC117173070 n=1 Tax=Belonocnema kinseyi TaxID=2817044 RepID=UPI00143CC6A3|nr:uncharacterized protein LOC117173070 [Belonocnema kinseyi]XP_033217341.1 uncharacterized protein LOC117173070 [Belonocnema kinseyi]